MMEDKININDEDNGKDKNNDDVGALYDPQLLLLTSSPVFSTHYDDRCGILAAASAAGITLWG